MSWLEGRDGPEGSLERVLALRPELLRGYRSFYGALWDEALLPARLLELCRLRIASLQDCDAEAAIEHAGSGLSEAERATLRCGGIPAGLSATEDLALQVAAKVPSDVHAIDDTETAALRDALGEPGLVALLIALPLFDANCRLRTALELEAAPGPVERPAGRERPLY